MRASWKWSLLTLVVITLVAGSFWLDEAAVGWAGQIKNPAVKNLAGLIADYGRGGFLLAGAAVAGFAAWRARRQQLLRMVVAMMIAASVAGMTANVIRWTTGRARPNAKIESGWYGMWHDSKWVAGKYEFSAFPSAHTATMTGLATVWLFASRRWGALSVLPGIAMGWARIVNRAHHLSDVCVAMIVGIAAAYWTWRFLMPRVSGFLSNKVERKA